MHLPHKITRIHWWALAQTAGPIIVISILALWLGLHYMQPAPPRTITMAAGAPGSAYEQAAKAYRKVLARNGITLNIRTSHGSIDNLKLLADPHSKVDIALVQSGSRAAGSTLDLVSLGGMFYQPLMIFYHSAKPMQRLSELRGKRVAVGPEGSGTRHIAQTLLDANGLDANALQMVAFEGEEARKALLAHEVDAIILTSDSATPATIRQMMREEAVRMFDFTRANAYMHRFPFLHKIVIPAGALDLGEDLPAGDLTLLAPMVEIIARPDLHPALIDLLLEAATEVHNRTTLLQTAGDFPKAEAADFPMSTAAARYYKSGDRSFLYRIMPFWLASLVNRLVVMIVPLVVIVIPGLRYVPQLYRWRINSRIHHQYGVLMAVERESLSGGLTDERRLALIERLNEIERLTIHYRIPGSHAEQLYLLRQHINFVRGHLEPHGPVSLPVPTPQRATA